MVFPLIAAVIGGVAGLGAAAINKSATDKASKVATQAAADNNALARETRDKIDNYVSPYMPGAYAATGELNRLLGLTGGSSGGNLLGGSGSGVDVGAYLQANPDVAAARSQIMNSGQVGVGKRWNSFEDWVLSEQIPNAQAAGEQRAYPTTAAASPEQSAAQNEAEGGYFGPQVADRPTYARPDLGSAPAAPNIDPSQYKQSPYFDFLMKQGNRNLKAGSAAGGIGQSGAAAKEAMEFASGLASQDYQKWVGNVLSIDGINRGQWNLDRDVANRNFDVDTVRDIGIYDSDRGYNTQRFDQRVGNLFGLSSQGLGAAGTLAGNQQNYLNTVSDNNNSAASAAGNAAIANANSTSNLIGQGLQGLGYLYGASRGGGAGSGAYDYSKYNLGWGS